ncbi:hypothetical protein C21_03773 [Arenibacter sp. NBRC 103722]|uniref:hypothetical protein n=1 Tax=unclassified Arenibacter TaxID=2615047 RepID=UPI00085357AB|nr:MULTISPECIES: hypothetical protein [unclassified Arenibacter]MDX1766430.1 hypothetical protein [Arenibacter troitsensis]HCO83142.1 hypothetical protein [Arenibacter sp.]MCM4164845.1 hypothetical protein [Arenibacter sp. A80]RFT55261.1 hypothetical protein D0S24_14680 [Arenibacter sp. P308M17]GBF21587.1 hypothetical protein C21_03773 [Arenibacter sp. NBRC 103722]|tara:strand:- start:128 stop:571 length:444 start_codon:yes stop_codon:yes gene_type:complete
MKTSDLFKTFIAGVMMLTVVSCSKDDDPTARITVNGTVLVGDVSDFNGDIDASFTGNGGSLTRSFVWNNSLTTADYNADITATAEGTFRMVVEDSTGEVVLDRSLNGAVEPDSYSGVTSSGASGVWTTTITVTDFNGDGSFSLSEGN